MEQLARLRDGSTAPVGVALPGGPRPRVCLISHIYLEGYVGKLRELGKLVDLRVVLPAGYPASFTAPELPADDPGFVVSRYRAISPHWRRSSTRWTLATVTFGFRQSPPDIVHVENERHSYIVLQVLAAKALFAPRARSVVFVWDNHRSGLAHERVTERIGRFMANRVDFFIAGNHDAKRLLLEDGVGPDRIAVVPAVGVDTAIFSPPEPEARRAARASLGILDGEFVVGYVGRFTVEKGLHDVARAVKSLNTTRSGAPRLRWLLVGAGPLEAQLDQWIADGLPAIRAQPVRQDETVRYYRAMDALVLASHTTPRWKEQFGRVLVEAMACGVPVLGSASGAIPEVIGDAGLVVPEGDAQALEAELGRLAHDGALRERLAQTGRKRAVELFSDVSVAQQTADAYERALALPPRASDRGSR